MRARGMTPAMNTNGFLLSAPMIDALGRAGLYAMQVSVDGVIPNATTMKSLKPLLPKLRLLSQRAAFRVRINTVLGASPPDEALEVARAAVELGFDAKCALARNADGTMMQLDERTREVYDELTRLEGRSLGVLHENFQDVLLRDGQVEWKCRAGARFFHVCENGLVHLCAPRYGAPATPLAEYSVDEIRRAFGSRKPCASTCPIAYAHMASRLDGWRSQSLELPPAARHPALALTAGQVRLRVVA